MSSLYIVSTPIGNLADMTHRAIDTLRAARRVLAEDTRRTAILLKHHGISTPLISAHEHNEAARVAQILSWLAAGEDLAIVSDAGTPLLSDPGARIVQAVIEAGHDVVPIPGASALLAALVASGVDPEPFTFFGFLPRSGRERKQRLSEIATLRHTVVIYEAPGRVAKLLEDLIAVAGDERRVTVGREITKLHETFVRGTLREAYAYYQDQQVRGEVAVVLAGAPEAKPEDQETAALVMARELLATGASPRDAAKQIARSLNVARNRAYEITQGIAAEGSPDS
ncbi:MAG: 16S rRNA (cytidine(1402)-2'-O)-methyltransferase [Gemmatimonadota bacterium]